MSISPIATAGPPREFDQETLGLADVYAESLLQVAAETGQVEAVAQEFGELIALMDRERDLELFLIADTVDADPRRASLEKIFRGRMSDPLLNTLQVLNNRGRLGLVRAVARCVQLRMEARRHQQEVTVRSAQPLTDSLREQIKRSVSEYIGKEALLIEEVAPELIGGLVLQIGDVQVDASVATRLQTLYRRLIERATAEVHEGQRYVVEA
ncbi:MAG TPA: ATP synthase F1 subunit delta [Phycisphaerae bacterium]|jgi:F-type H+-transporting ATPase subunit delta|nr:ATP synthase F1 subunit delta [Phycisphaerae bacterium]HOB75233.1 ATP synthase F1 subunit delta [Phycisphaerae bacterium]HOJ54714.1 ATP synthase F1 subunit delta [Phycisphaerae bacterium]HOL25935.1 ATP synthase F1 subunit delta [Phycisphaerae bacterium]HPP19492.1 ATP synthase F1 subunit delta [Phycisphaerae bacterium]